MGAGVDPALLVGGTIASRCSINNCSKLTLLLIGRSPGQDFLHGRNEK